MTAPYLPCERVDRFSGGLQALKGVSMHIDRGEIFGLVGPNGSGRTTLVNAVTGFEKLEGMEQMNRFHLIEHELTGEDEELTPTMKVKRKLVDEMSMDLIDSRYASGN